MSETYQQRIPAPTDLPAIFEEFDDARRAGFINAMNFKQNGGRLVGLLCSYTPIEIIEAAGACGIGLCGTSNEPVADAETVLPKNLCPLVKSTYGFAMTEKCPFTYFSDMIIAETTCDAKKKMYELLGEIKETHILNLPHTQGRQWAVEAWREECRLLKERLEELYGVTITDDDLRQAIATRNRLRELMLELFEMQQNVPPVASGIELLTSGAANTFCFDVDQAIGRMEALVAKRREDYANGVRPIGEDRKRILLTGCPSMGVLQKVGMAIERNGGVIVCVDDCSGERTQAMLIDEQAADPIAAIADRYFKINCSIMSPNTGRLENPAHMCELYTVDGVVEFLLTACHTFAVESAKVERKMEEMGMPYLRLESDYAPNDAGQLDTRIAAFIEML